MRVRSRNDYTIRNTKEKWDEKKSRNMSNHLKYFAAKVACVVILQALVNLFLVHCLVFTVTRCTYPLIKNTQFLASILII